MNIKVFGVIVLSIAVIITLFIIVKYRTSSDHLEKSGRELMIAGKYDEAVRKLTSSIQNNPYNIESYINRAAAFYAEGKYENAISDYTKIIELRNNDFSAYNNRALAYLKTGNNQEAISDYTKAITLNPNLAVSFYGRGEAHLAVKNTKQALQDFIQAEKLGHAGAKKRIAEIKK